MYPIADFFIKWDPKAKKYYYENLKTQSNFIVSLFSNGDNHKLEEEYYIPSEAVALCEKMIVAGANINVQNENGNTVLFEILNDEFYSTMSREEIIFLINHPKIDLNIKNKQGISAFDLLSNSPDLQEKIENLLYRDYEKTLRNTSVAELGLPTNLRKKFQYHSTDNSENQQTNVASLQELANNVIYHHSKINPVPFFKLRKNLEKIGRQIDEKRVIEINNNAIIDKPVVQKIIKEYDAVPLVDTIKLATKYSIKELSNYSLFNNWFTTTAVNITTAILNTTEIGSKLVKEIERFLPDQETKQSQQEEQLPGPSRPTTSQPTDTIEEQENILDSPILEESGNLAADARHSDLNKFPEEEKAAKAFDDNFNTSDFNYNESVDNFSNLAADAASSSNPVLKLESFKQVFNIAVLDDSSDEEAEQLFA